MTGGSNIRAVGPAADAGGTIVEETVAAQPAAEDEVLLEEQWQEDEAEDTSTGLRSRWVAPTLALLATAAWTGFFGWTYRAEIASGASAAQWIDWAVRWTVPVMLIAVLWLIATRNSRREAARFGEVANLLSHESQLLETRLTTINRELSLAREFLASQSRELDSLGRVATDRLSTHSDRLQALVHDNGQQVEAIATVSTTALENMNKLRDDLPVIANSARDVSNQIGNAGRTASDQVAELVTGFERLNDFGQASERQVDALKVGIHTALASFEDRMDDLERIASERFGTLRETSEDFRVELDGREVEALAALRRRAESLSAELRTTHAALESEEEEALVSLRARLGGLRDEARTVGNAVREHEEAAIGIWRSQVEAIQAQLVEAIDVIKGIDDNALASANRKLDALRQEAEVVDQGIIERDRRLQAQIAERQRNLADAERESVETLAARLADLDAAIAQRREEHAERTAQLAASGEAVVARLAELRADIEHVANQGSETEQVLARSLEKLGAKLGESREALGGTHEAVADLTEASVRLLELIRASAEHSREDLPQALGEAETRLATLTGNTDGLKLMLEQARETSERLSDYVIGARDTGREALTEFETLHRGFAESNQGHAEKLAELRAAITALDEDSTALAERTQSELREAIERLDAAARAAGEAIGEDALINVGRLAERIGSETSDALDRILREKTREAIDNFEESTAKAAQSSRDAAVQLRDQLARVDELAGNLESRVARARERAEEQVDNDFARRMALITESLNSSSIDIAKALSSEVTDTAWASYLRGDRGIFTRRAVRLLDNVEAREIAEHYDNEPDFRENVNRYVADFEGMLRTMLSTRDGHALGVTLLSSDVGKLYVALAQGIERLRE